MTASLLVLAVVAAALLYYLDQCRRLRAQAGTEFRELVVLFAKDIATRAGRGQDPDWTRYSEEGDRRHEVTCESMRNMATTALATGVGGTMTMLLLHFWLPDAGSSLFDFSDRAGAPVDSAGAVVEAADAVVDAAGVVVDSARAVVEAALQPTSASAVPALFEAMGFALLASAFGVVTNLIILLGFLRSTSAQFDRKRAAFVAYLQKKSEEHPPQGLSSKLAGTMGERLEDALRASAQSFPDVIRSFNDSVGALEAVAHRFHDGTAAIDAAVAKLHAWTKDVEDAREDHLAVFRAATEAGAHVRRTLDAHERAVRDIADRASEVTAAAHGLPQAFAEEVRRSSDVLGREFGTRAQNHVGDLIAALRERNAELSAAWDGHVNRMLNEMANLVHEGLRPTLEPTAEGIARVGSDLAKLGDQVRTSIGEFADRGTEFRNSLGGATATIDESSSRLAAAHELTRAMVADARDRYEAMHVQLVESLDRLEATSRGRRGLFGRVRGWFGSRRKRSRVEAGASQT